MSSLSEQIVTHPDAAWRSRANFLIQVDLAAHGLPGCLEQLWALQRGPREFEVCCLPFFAYGIALGDVVRTRGAQAPDLVFAATLHPSGRRVLRIALTGYPLNPALHEHLHSAVSHSGLFHEWHRAEYLAVDLPTVGSEEPLTRALQAPLAAGDAQCEITP